MTESLELPASHLLELDGLRGIAVLLVVLFHTVGEAAVASNSIDSAVLNVAKFGWVGVDLFFVLSGFLITGILYDNKQAIAAGGRVEYFKTFYVRRTLRIFPLYYAFLVVYLLVLPFIWPSIHDLRTGPDLALWLYAIDFKGHSAPTNHFWSLAVEEQFYLLWPWLVAFLPRRRLLVACVGVIAFAMAFRAIIVLGLLPVHPIKASTMFFARADSLATGALVAVLARSERGRALMDKSLGWLGVGSAVVFLALRGWSGDVQMWSSPLVIVAYILPSVAFAALLHRLVFGGESRMRAIMRTPVLRKIGRHSYAIYVLHFPLILLAATRFGLGPEFFGSVGGVLAPGWLLVFVITTAATLLLALLTWYLIEGPALRLKERFAYRVPPSVGGDVGVMHGNFDRSR